MSRALQMKLLRVLQEREFEKVGRLATDQGGRARDRGDQQRPRRDGRRTGASARTSSTGSTSSRCGCPPLRDRRDDIPLLVQHFLERFCRDLVPARPAMTVSQQAMRRLMAYAWPGNVRQLENVLERAVALSGGRPQIELADLPADVQEAADEAGSGDFELPEEGIDFQQYVSNIERQLILQSLERTGGNKGRAAQLLNLKRTTLVEKLKRLGDGTAQSPSQLTTKSASQPITKSTNQQITNWCFLPNNLCHPASPTGRSSSTDSRRRSAQRSAKRSYRRSGN